jgi:hypothetical protein
MLTKKKTRRGSDGSSSLNAGRRRTGGNLP